VNLIQVGEKHSATYRLEVKNPGGHSSLPVKENAIYRLADALHRLAAYEFEFQLNDVTRSYLETLAGLESEPTASQLRRAAGGDPAAMRAAAEASPTWNAVMRTTCVATGLDGGHAVVTLPYMVMGGTDGRLLRQAGIPTYGVQGIFFDVADIRFHGRDERLGVREFYEGQEFLYRLVKDLAR